MQSCETSPLISFGARRCEKQLYHSTIRAERDKSWNY